MGGHALTPPTHRRLGGPLPRQLANGTHTHPSPPGLSPPGDAAQWSNAGLFAVSSDFPPGKGRLCTRYSPVRRCHCWPLDLHVLGPPLAFILSQDQTLHCTFFLSLCCPPLSPRGDVVVSLTSSLATRGVNELFRTSSQGNADFSADPYVG